MVRDKGACGPRALRLATPALGNRIDAFLIQIIFCDGIISKAYCREKCFICEKSYTNSLDGNLNDHKKQTPSVPNKQSHTTKAQRKRKLISKTKCIQTFTQKKSNSNKKI
jgi:hypothetical protein